MEQEQSCIYVICWTVFFELLLHACCTEETEKQAEELN